MPATAVRPLLIAEPLQPVFRILGGNLLERRPQLGTFEAALVVRDEVEVAQVFVIVGGDVASRHSAQHRLDHPLHALLAQLVGEIASGWNEQVPGESAPAGVRCLGTAHGVRLAATYRRASAS